MTEIFVASSHDFSGIPRRPSHGIRSIPTDSVISGVFV